MNRVSTWLLALGAFAVQSAGADLAEIRERGVLRVVIERDTLPELFAPGSDTRPGFEQEILQGFAHHQGLRLEIVPVATIEERIPALLDGRADVGAGIVVTDSRRKLVDFSADVLPIRHVAVTLPPQPSLTTVEALRRVRVGTIRGSSWAEQVARAGVPKEKIDASFETVVDLVQALRTQRVDATVLSVVWAMSERSRHPDLQLGVLLGEPTSISFAIAKESPQLRAALDTYLRNIYAASLWDRLVVKYFGDAGLDLLKKSRGQ